MTCETCGHYKNMKICIKCKKFYTYFHISITYIRKKNNAIL